jgi:hypothetical protein
MKPETPGGSCVSQQSGHLTFLLTLLAVLPGAALGTCAALAGAPDSTGAKALGDARGDPLERVEMRDGRVYEGLIESEEDYWINLTEIVRPAGRPMRLVIRPLDRAAIARTVRLPPDQRARLREQVEQFIDRASIEAGRQEAVRLATVQAEGAAWRRYRGRWFLLDSTADEAGTRRIIVRVEQLFTAYRQLLHPRHEPARPLRLVVLGSQEEYHAYLARRGLHLRNQACFILRENLLVAGSELARFAAEIANITAAHDALRTELDALERKLPGRLREYAKQLQESGRPRTEIGRLLALERQKARRQIAEKQQQVQAAERQNAQAFQRATGQMFTRLGHEAFHAYLENYVFPHDQYDVPPWLNEGLAVMIEGGILEGESLRVDAPNREALKRLKADLAGPSPLALGTLLAADVKAFLVQDDESALSSRQHYAAAWGLVYYLTFQERLLGGAKLSAYVRRTAPAVPPAARFESFVGRPLPQCEQDWRRYIRTLRP